MWCCRRARWPVLIEQNSGLEREADVTHFTFYCRVELDKYWKMTNKLVFMLKTSSRDNEQRLSSIWKMLYLLYFTSFNSCYTLVERKLFKSFQQNNFVAHLVMIVLKKTTFSWRLHITFSEMTWIFFFSFLKRKLQHPHFLKIKFKHSHLVTKACENLSLFSLLSQAIIWQN